MRGVQEGERTSRQSFLWVQENVSADDSYTMQFLFCDTGPVAGFISGGSRAGKDRGAWVCTAGDKEKERNVRERQRRRKCQANQS